MTLVILIVGRKKWLGGASRYSSGWLFRCFGVFWWKGGVSADFGGEKKKLRTAVHYQMNIIVQAGA